ncbi:MAG: aldehyde dehydrogenase [Candidatus Binatota bacterium]|nr:aldehyde dehydrogenase [Candidatus Binatota bacterium]
MTGRLFIAGEWRDARSGRTHPVPNPATEEVVGHAADAGREDARDAIAAARAAFDSGPWRKATPRDRSKVLLAIADGVERRKEELRSVLVSAAGAEYVTHGIQLDVPIELLRLYADLALRFELERPLPPVSVPTATGMRVVSSTAVRQPAGVCGLIPTWNFPLFVTVQKLGPAIATGCTMVVKPSPYVPLVDCLLAEIVESADVPKGVYNLVTGESPELGGELVESPLVDKVSFTGSVATGKRIMELASRTLKRVHLELGGKSALLVLEDADLDEVVASAASPAFFHAGQGCAINTRILVARRKQDALVERMKAFVEMIVRVGDPADPGVMLGPLIREERRSNVEEHIAAGRDEGAVLATGGGRPAGLDRGFFLEPTIFRDVTNDMRVAREEIFGPVACVIPFDDEEQAIAIANDSRYGLGGGIVTRDVGRAIEIAKRIRSGTIGINGAYDLFDAPFGGFKESGIGREGGSFGLQEYTELQCISWIG